MSGSRICILLLLLIFTGNALCAQNLRSATDKNTCLFGYKNDSGKWVIPPIYKYANEFDANTGIAVVELGSKSGLLGKDGRTRGLIEYDFIDPYPIFEYIDSGGGKYRYYYNFSSGKLYGLLDTNGKVVFPARFPNIHWKQGNLIGGYKEFYDLQGKRRARNVTLEREWDDHHRYFINGIALFYKFRKLWTLKKEDILVDDIPVYGMVDTNGTIRLPARYTKIEKINDSLFVVTGMDGNSGLVNNKGKIILPAVYDYSGSGLLIFDKYPADVLKFSKFPEQYLYSISKGKLLFNGNSTSEADDYSKIVIVHDHKKYGLGTVDGEWILQPSYDAIIDPGKPGYYIVSSGGKYGLIDSTGKMILPLMYNSITAHTYSNQPVKLYYEIGLDSKYGIADSMGRILEKPDDGKLYFDSASTNALVFNAVQYNSAFMVIATPIGDYATPYHSRQKLSVIGDPDRNDPGFMFSLKMGVKPHIHGSDIKSYLVDSNGNVLQSSSGYYFTERLLPDGIEIIGNKGVGVMSLSGNIIVKPALKAIENIIAYYKFQPYRKNLKSLLPPNDSFYYFEDRAGKLGVMDRHFHSIIPAKYDSISDNRGCWFVHHKHSRKWDMISVDGKTVLQKGFNAIPEDFGAFFVVRSKSKDALLAKDGSWLTGFDFNGVDTTPYNNIYVVIRNGKYGLINAGGKIILPIEYESIGTFTDGLSLVKKDGKSGLIDSTGNFIIKPEWMQICNALIAFDKIYKLNKATGKEPLFYSSQRKASGQNMLCYHRSKTRDSIPGVETEQYVSKNGYYVLLKNYPDVNAKNRINNYIINLAKNGDNYPVSMQGDFAIPAATDLTKNWFSAGDFWSPLCNQTDYNIKIISRHIVGIQCHRNFPILGFSPDSVSYDYLYLYRDSVKKLEAQDFFISEQWKDTVAKRIAETVYGYCIGKDTIDGEHRYDAYKSHLEDCDFIIDTKGITWKGNRTYGLFGDVFVSYADLRPILKPNGPLSEFVK
jgi:hypothetical protein